MHLKGGGGLPKKKTPALKLTIEQDSTVFDYVEAHQELYNKGHPDFLKTGQKLALWESLAESLKATEYDGE